jgi:hypothetical protein
MERAVPAGYFMDKEGRKCHVSLMTGEQAKPAKCVVAVYRTVRRVGWSDTH